MLTKTQPDEIQDYLADASYVKGGHASLVVFPESAADVAEILAKASKDRTPRTVRRERRQGRDSAFIRQVDRGAVANVFHAARAKARLRLFRRTGNGLARSLYRQRGHARRNHRSPFEVVAETAGPSERGRVL